MSEIAFTVHGIPAPAGSKRGFVRAEHVIITDDSRRSRPWKAQIADAAAQAMLAAPLLIGPLVLEATFYMPRPKGHYRTGRNADLLRAGAPLYPTVKPDTTKLLRALEDALTGIVWRDDAQVVNQWVRKMYGEPARVEVRIAQLDDLADAQAA